MNPIRERTIPGFATYFWFIADRNLMATVKLHNKVTAQATLQKYIQCFLKQSSEHAKAEVIELEDGSHELKVTGYMLDVNDAQEERKHYYPRFNANLIKNPGKHEEIRQKANFILKMLVMIGCYFSGTKFQVMASACQDKLRMQCMGLIRR
ncbi:hypothetical protein [Klebsiella quasipneumoniae]|uniref:hypothetical protein n=1 Tax=Klebsiella quasipneumoniae TaxID=1463165 RepID=UPI0021F98F30|nr:hypothetical protein [Klebsiella quasipneumoniae]BDO04243.1 hypothetical protein KAM622c_38300 [Klebsiella quasipneumoniae subsp. quasipneumoniae]